MVLGCVVPANVCAKGVADQVEIFQLFAVHYKFRELLSPLFEVFNEVIDRLLGSYVLVIVVLGSRAGAHSEVVDGHHRKVLHQSLVHPEVEGSRCRVTMSEDHDGFALDVFQAEDYGQHVDSLTVRFLANADELLGNVLWWDTGELHHLLLKTEQVLVVKDVVAGTLLGNLRSDIG